MTYEMRSAALDRLQAAARLDDRYPPAAELREGMLVAERYELVRWLGEGGMGAVWAAKHVHTRKQVALKFIKPTGEGARSPSHRRSLREARAATVIRHPNIVAIHDILDVLGAPMLVMDLLEGESLGACLSRRGRLPLGETAAIVLKLASAISAAHAAGIVHRDLKPDNIFLVAEAAGGACDVKVLDFGLAKLTATEGDAATSGGLTRSGDIVGTPQYMAPEQAFGERDIDHRVDIWALGVILYECLAGSRPFPGENLGQVIKRLMSGRFVPVRALAPAVPKELATLIERMLSRDRERRPSDLHELRRTLTCHAGAESGRAASPPLGRRASLRRVGLAAASLLIAGAVAVPLRAYRRQAHALAGPGFVAPDGRAATVAAIGRPPAPLAAASRAAPIKKTVDSAAWRAKAKTRRRPSAPRVVNEDESQIPLFLE